ncbi:MAG TPA: hypothetical protein VJ672_15500 [Gemmatimonadaceae bacterium]|nr:hypothetical protein [Gemmatimonadaceae bacterium]
MVAEAQVQAKRVQSARATPRIAIARSLPSVVILDMSGDGVNLDGTAKTSLLTGGPVSARWTTAGSDDAFLLVDATSLRAAGVSLMNSSKEALEGSQLFRDGLRVKDPGGKESVISDGWQLLGVLDSNQDGKIDSSDPAWGSLRLFVDKNADGTINPGELTAVAEARMGALENKVGEKITDAAGRSRADGSFSTADGETRTMSSVATTP